MAQPYVGEIRFFAGNFPPAGWMFCDGQELPISEYETLFNLIGTTYGGDGQDTFALPNLQSRVPIHTGTGSFGTTYPVGDTNGVESVTLTTNQIPSHSHSYLLSSDVGTQISPNQAILGSGQAVKLFRPGTAVAAFNASAIQADGGSQPHDNMQPYLCLNYIISLFGIFPSQT